MRKLLIGSIALLSAGLLAVAGFALLGPDGAQAQEKSEPSSEYRFTPLDEVLDELVDEKVIDTEQADAIRQRMGDRMAGGFRFEGEGPHGPMGFGFMEGLPEGFTPPSGPPGTPEFDAWLDEMKSLMGDDFFGGHMFGFDGDLPEGGFFDHGPGRMGPGMMGDGFHHLGDMNIEDLQGFIDDMAQRFGGEVPDHVQDMIDHLREQISETSGAETSFDA